jgi:cell division protein FtsN
VFLIVGGWRARTANAETIAVGAQTSHAVVASANMPAAQATNLFPEVQATPIRSTNVNLYESTKAGSVELSPVVPDLPKGSQVPAAIKAADGSPMSAPNPKPAKLMAALADRKGQKGKQNAAATQIAATPIPSETVVASASQPAPDLTAVLAEAEANATHAPVGDAGSTASQLKTVDSTAKVAKLFVEVGTFKEETWASGAVDQLTQLGFHAVMVHKTVLWVQSYHVQVGPYANPQELAEAQKSLAAHGFKAHPVS